MTLPVLIGSRALDYWVYDFNCKEGADWDFVCGPECDDYLKETFGDKVDISRPDELFTFNFIEKFGTVAYRGRNDLRVLEPKGLAAIKRSHLWRDHNFEKHILQYHLHLNPFEGFTETEWDLINRRAKLTKEKYPQGNPSLAQSNDDFFDDSVEKKFDHDWLHELYAYGHRPMYEKMKKDFSKAWCERDMWGRFSKDEKRLCVAEECYVIATERFLVPRGYKFPAKLAYIKALNKVCTTLTSGWFRDYAIDNYMDIRELFDQKRFDKVQETLQNA